MFRTIFLDLVLLYNDSAIQLNLHRKNILIPGLTDSKIHFETRANKEIMVTLIFFRHFHPWLVSGYCKHAKCNHAYFELLGKCYDLWKIVAEIFFKLFNNLFVCYFVFFNSLSPEMCNIDYYTVVAARFVFETQYNILHKNLIAIMLLHWCCLTVFLCKPIHGHVLHRSGSTHDHR